MSEKTDLLLSLNYENNFLSLADYLLLLSAKHKDNKKVKALHIALQEMYFHTNTIMIKNRELETEISDIRSELNKNKNEQRKIKRVIY